MATDNINKLLQLKELYETGVITREELEAEKAKLLGGANSNANTKANAFHSEKVEKTAPKKRARKDPKWIYFAGIALVVVVAAILLLPKMFEKHPTALYSAPTGSENGYGYVDMGLAVKWATCNIGAETPFEDGLFFNWGTVSPVPNYIPDYSYIERYYYSLEHPVDFEATEMIEEPIIPIIPEEGEEEPRTEIVKPSYPKYNEIDGKTVLDMEDDAAHVMLGRGWRIPRKEDFNELFANCEVSLVKYKKSKYLLFTSKINGNSILFSFYHSVLTANLCEDNPVFYYDFSAFYDEHEYNYKNIQGREDWIVWNIHTIRDETPLPIRPVCDK